MPNIKHPHPSRQPDPTVELDAVLELHRIGAIDDEAHRAVVDGELEAHEAIAATVARRKAGKR